METRRGSVENVSGSSCCDNCSELGVPNEYMGVEAEDTSEVLAKFYKERDLEKGNREEKILERDHEDFYREPIGIGVCKSVESENEETGVPCRVKWFFWLD